MVFLDTMRVATEKYEVSERNRMVSVGIKYNHGRYVPTLRFCDSNNVLKNTALKYSDPAVIVWALPDFFGKSQRLVVIAHVPKLTYDNNLNPTNAGQNKDAVRKLITLLESIGIFVKAKDLVITRLDLARNFVCKHDFNYFKFFLNSGKPFLRQYIRSKDEWAVKGNKTWSIAIYNKTLQMKEKHNLKVIHSELENIFRIEVKILRKSKIEKLLGDIYVKNNLLAITKEKSLAKILGLFKKIVNEHLQINWDFPAEDVADDYLLALYLRDNGYTPSKIERILHLRSHIEKGDVNLWIRIVCGNNRNLASKMRKKARTIQEELPILNKDLMRIYKEIFGKIFDDNHCSDFIEVKQINLRRVDHENGKPNEIKFIIQPASDCGVSRSIRPDHL